MSGKSLLPLIEYEAANAEVRAVYDDIMATRKTDWINNFWKVLAHDPAQLRRMWESLKEIMGPGALDPLTKELIYIAVSATNGCEYCTYSHTASARAKGMTDAQFTELLEGCPTCGGTGYKGRVGIHELMTNSEELTEAINKELQVAELKRIAMKNGMKTLHQDSMLKVKLGLTTIEEALSNVPPDLIF